MDAHLVILGHGSSRVPHLSVVEVVASQSSTIGHLGLLSLRFAHCSHGSFGIMSL